MSAHSSHSARLASTYSSTSPRGGSGLSRRNRVEQPTRGARDLAHRGVERLAVRPRRGPVAAHLPHELERGLLDLLLRGGLVRPPENLDASAHAREHPTSPLPPPYRVPDSARRREFSPRPPDRADRVLASREPLR